MGATSRLLVYDLGKLRSAESSKIQPSDVILENDRFRENHHKCDPINSLSNLWFSKTFLETLFSIDHTYDEF